MLSDCNKALTMIDRAAAEFARRQLATELVEHDRYPFSPFCENALQTAYEIDLFHTILPATSDGVGQGMTALCLILDNICRIDSSFGGIIFTNAFAQKVLLSAEDDNTIQSIVSSATNARQFLIAYPVFNNPGEIEPVIQASIKDDRYILTGTVEYLVLGGITDKAVIPAKTSGQNEYSFFFIDLCETRIIKTDTVLSLGFHACPAIDITLNNIEGTLIGREGQGPVYFESASDSMHVAAAAMSAGIMKGSYQEAFEYSQKRFQGGRKISDWSEVQMILSNMAIKIKIAELAIAQACQAVDQFLPQWEQCSYATAIYVQEMACDVTTDGIQVLGGAGYMEDFGQAKRYRDAKHAQSLLGIAPMKKLRYFNKH